MTQFIEKALPQRDSTADKDLRVRTFHHLLAAITALLWIVALTSVYRSVQFDLSPSYLGISLAIWLAATATYIFRNRLSLFFKEIIVFCLMYGMFFNGVLNFGLSAPSLFLSAFIPLFVLQLHGQKTAFIHLGLVLSCLLLVGGLYSSGMVTLAVDLNTYNRTLVSWLAELISAGVVVTVFIMEYRPIEAALRANEERSRAIFDSVNDAIFIHDLETGAILDVNQKMCEMYGYTKDEVLRIDVGAISSGQPPYTQEDALLYIRKAAAGQPQLFEWRAKHRDGRLFWVEVNMRRSAIGGVDRLMVTVRNITDRKNADDALQVAQGRIQRQHAVVAAIAVSPDLVSGDIRELAVKIDERAAKALGVERVGVWLFDVTGDELRCIDLYEDSAGRHAAGAVLRRHEYENEFEALRTARYVDAHDPLTDPRTAGYVEGYLKPLHITSMLDAVIREAGRNLGVICFEHVDQAHHWETDEITFACQIADQIAIALMNRERILAGEALRESEFRYRSMIDSARDVVFVIDPQGRMLSLNPAFETATGFSMNKWLGKPFVELLHPHDVQNTLKRAQSVLNSEQSGYFECRIRTSSGGYAIAEIQGFPLVEKGAVTGMVGFARDVTESRKLEQQLIQTQKMEAIGTLAGGIAHDFNNMLFPILGYTEMARMLAKGDPNPKLSEYLGHITEAATRATDLVRQILTFSRKAEQRKMRLQVSPIVKEALKLLRSSIPTTIEIKQEVATQALVLADPTQIHQVMMNLCTNAYHAMEHTGGVLAVSLKETEIPQGQIMGDEITPGRYVVLEVSDTGCGMDEKTKKLIFEPYFTTKEKGKGTGLGLAVVHGIVKDCQGRITVYSELGRGTTFRVYLPATEGGTEERPQVQPSATPTARHERILFVDDEEVTRTMAKDYLTGYGYVVDVCSNGRDALFAIEQDRDAYDLLITDMTMPVMNGMDLSKKVLALRSDLPVILCTGYSSLIGREGAAQIGIRDYVEKPVVLSDLLSRIEKVLIDHSNRINATTHKGR